MFPPKNIVNSHSKKNIGGKMSFYLNIFLSFYCNIACENCLSDEYLTDTYILKKCSCCECHLTLIAETT